MKKRILLIVILVLLIIPIIVLAGILNENIVTCWNFEGPCYAGNWSWTGENKFDGDSEDTSAPQNYAAYSDINNVRNGNLLGNHTRVLPMTINSSVLNNLVSAELNFTERVTAYEANSYLRVYLKYPDGTESLIWSKTITATYGWTNSGLIDLTGNITAGGTGNYNLTLWENGVTGTVTKDFHHNWDDFNLTVAWQDDEPLWQNNATNESDGIIAPGGSIELAAQGQDSISLEWGWLSTNETGAWYNYTDVTYTIYNYSDITNNKAYGGAASSYPENSLGTVFTSTMYANANGSDDIYAETNATAGNNFPFHHFIFKVNESENDIQSMNVMWEGQKNGTGSAYIRLYANNTTSASYTEIANFYGVAEVDRDLSFEIVSDNITDFINDTGHIDFKVYVPTGPSRISTDNINLTVISSTYYNSPQYMLGAAGMWNWTNFSWSNTSLTSGDVCWRIFYNDSSEQTNGTDQSCFSIRKAPTKIDLYLNGTETNKTYNQYEIANFTAKVNITGLTVNLTSNYTGFIQQNGTTSIINYTTLNTAGDWWNLTAWTVGNNSYSGSSQTYFFNVTTVILGNLTISLTTPPEGEVTNVEQYTTFWVNSTIQCTDADCGIVSATVRRNSTTANPDTLISTTEGATPFYIDYPSSYLWRANVTGPTDEFGGVTVVNDYVYICSKEKEICFALNSSTGAEIWNHSTGTVDTPPTYYNGILYITAWGDDVNTTWALNATNGSQIWNYTISDPFPPTSSVGGPAVKDDIVVFFGEDCLVFALNATNGSLIWNYTVPSGGCEQFANSPTVWKDYVFFIPYKAGATAPTLYAFNLTNGSQIWNHSNLTWGAWDSSPSIDEDGRLFICAYMNWAGLWAINATTGEDIWNNSLSDQIDDSCYITPGIYDGVVYGSVVAYTRFHAVNATNGADLDNVILGETESFSSPAIVDNLIFTANLDGVVYGLNRSTLDVVWNYTTGDSIYSQMVVADGKLFVASDDWYLYAFEFGAGDGNWTTLGQNSNRTGYTENGLYVNSLGSMSQDDTRQIKWLVNATGTVDTEWAIDVNASGTTVSANNSADAFIKIVAGAGTTFTVLMPSMYAGSGYSYPITATTEPAANQTNWISFNFSAAPQTNVQPNTAGNFSNNQTGPGKPIFLIDNTGGGGINISLKFNQTLPTGINVSANASCTGTCTGTETTKTLLTTSYQTFAWGLSQTDSYANITLWGDTNTSAPGGEDYRWLLTKSEQT